MSGSLPITFHPAHAQPFTLEQAMLLEINILVAEIQRLENSIQHLRETQSQLTLFLQTEDDQDLRQAYQENEIVIDSQSERITLIKVALLNKVGQDSAAHYGISDIDTSTTTRTGTRTGTGIGTGTGTAAGTGIGTATGTGTDGVRNGTVNQSGTENVVHEEDGEEAQPGLHL
ncbi:hypothetical protein BCR39DRAFT_511452 [Naematelia encephala]|uniref:Uncharacterized protein n=1 Tax=Naematelia encephala TaxID=71784 RepID=A0A1Y2BLP7_9TREE|nr:hypothetical protein BCR39DRAFT_511452 [Naematelia encephala]